MKPFQQNLLIVLALALCGLCAFQWHEQTAQRNEITSLNGIVSDKNVTIRDSTNTVATLSHQLDQLDAEITDLKAAMATNDQRVAAQKKEITQLQFAHENDTNQIAQYQAAVDALEAKLKDAYAGIERQNQTVTNLVAQRDDFVTKYNDEVKARNDVVSKYNDLVNQIQKQQAGTNQ
jgi:chromosome segregation ATPase